MDEAGQDVQQRAMIEATLIPSGTAISQKGDSPAIDISGANHAVFLLTLTINEVVEQEYLELQLHGSADGANWGAPLAALQQHFYAGEYPTLVDLTADQGVKFLRVHWEVVRWGRGELSPLFTCGLTLQEVPLDLLADALAEAGTRRS